MDITRDRTAIKALLAKARRIAVVGVKDDAAFPARTFRFLRERYDVVPVNPEVASVQGVPCAKQVTEPFDIVDIFRGPLALEAHVEEAIAAKAKAVWFEVAAINSKAIDRALAAGLTVVVDRSIKVEMET